MREKKLIKFIKEALKREYMYTTDEIVYMKKEMNNLKQIVQKHNKSTRRGFGNS